MFCGSPASLLVRLLEAGTSFFVKASLVPVCPELVYVEPGDVCTGGRGAAAMNGGHRLLVLEPKQGSKSSGWVLGQGDCYMLQVLLY